MSKRDNQLLIEDMHMACRRILKYTKDLDYQTFLNDEKTIDATVHNIQILGEAAKQVSKDIQKKYNKIEWTKIIRSRHIIVHEYFELDYEIIWRIVQDYIPPLNAELKEIVNN